MTPVDQAEQLIKRGGHVHLMGIGGIGMAGVAWLLKERGLKVSGCDLKFNRQTEWLSIKGIPVVLGHHDSHITDNVDWLVRSTAVSDTHPEVHSAQQRGIPVSRRGEVLPALMRDRICIAVSGTHGKTTTTAMIAQVLQCGYCVGGEIVGFEGVAKDGEIMVVEADESDGTVAGYTPDYAVITNIEYDHMEHHASEAAFIGCFEKLIQNTSKKVFFREDDPISRKLCSSKSRCEPFDYPTSPLPLPLPGKHNQWNAAAAMAVAGMWKHPDEILGALARIKPVRRRFETVWEGRGFRVVSDYAHHPTEIAALIQTARELKPARLLGVFQPHRYTRTLALGPDFPASFEGLEHLWLVPVYAASEQPVEGGTTEDLANRFSAEWEARITCCSSLGDVWSDIRSRLRAGDLLLIIGAGDIEQLSDWAREL
jgi:UDP-N-acetylmuramate--alanine ligase